MYKFALMLRFILITMSLNLAILSWGQYHTETEILNCDGLQRSFEVFFPSNDTGNKNIPVLFVLHGGGGNEKGIIRTTHARFNKLAIQEGFIVVYPNGYGKSWNDGGRDTLGIARKLQIDDVGFFDKMIKHLDSRYAVDRQNIFACGISNGGFMVQRLAFELSDKIKGIGVVAASMSVIQSRKTYPVNPVSVIFINGTRDPLVPYEGGDVTVFKQKRGKVLSVEESIKKAEGD